MVFKLMLYGIILSILLGFDFIYWELNSVLYFSTIILIITFFNNGKIYYRLALFDNESTLINPLYFCNLLFCIYYNELRLFLSWCFWIFD
jgi:hypothetical protein